MTTSTTGRGVSRRDLLKLGGGLAVLAVAGCGKGSSQSGGAASTDLISIPDSKNKLPTGEVSFRLMDSGDTKAPFWKQFFVAYDKKHPNIKSSYDALPWNRIEEVVPLGIRNGSAHDVMQLPPTIPLSQAVAEGWVAPLNDLIPDFEAWQKSFPAEVFAEGVQIFNGKTYAVPLTSDQRSLCLLHYNKKLMDQAGLDPASEPFTWDTYRQAAKKITEQGKGRAYGVVLEVAQTPRLANWVDYLARSAGAASVGGIDLKTGRYGYAKDEVIAAIELMLALKADGSIFPGSASLVAPEAWPRVARGNAGMVLAGPWVTRQWETQNKGFEFGVASHPVAQADGPPPGYPVFGTDGVVVFGGSKNKEIAGDVLSYVTSVGGQKAWGDVVGVGNPPINEEARKAIKDSASPQGQKCLELAEKMVANPAPELRNADVSKVLQELKPVKPTFGEVIQAAFVGKAGDLKKALTDLDSRSERALDAAFAAAAKKGAKVDRNSWVFPNWDPSKPYTRADYEAL